MPPRAIPRIAAAAAGTTGDAVLPDHIINTDANSNTIANNGSHTAAEGEEPTLTLAMVQNLNSKPTCLTSPNNKHSRSHSHSSSHHRPQHRTQQRTIH